MPDTNLSETSLELARALAEVETLIDRRSWTQARERLLSLEQRFPDRPAVLHRLADIYLRLQDLPNYLLTHERIALLEPDDPPAILNLAGAYLITGYDGLAWRTLLRFLARWPDYERADEAHHMLHDLEQRVRAGRRNAELTTSLEAQAAREEAQIRAERRAHGH